MRGVSAAAFSGLGLTSVAALALLLAEACSSFSEEPQPTPETSTPDGAADAPVDAPADVATNTDSGEAGPPLTGCALRYASGDAGIDGGALVFCDDFEGKKSPEERWELPFMANGELALEPNTVYAGQASLGLASKGTGTTLVSLATPDLSMAALPLYVELDLYPQQVPAPAANMPYNGFVLATFLAKSGADQLVYVGVPGNGQLNPYLSQGDPIVNLPIGDWYHVVIRYDVSGNTLDFIPRSGAVQPVRRMGLGAPTGRPQSVRLGIETGGGPMRIFIDDVFIHQ